MGQSACTNAIHEIHEEYQFIVGLKNDEISFQLFSNFALFERRLAFENMPILLKNNLNSNQDVYSLFHNRQNYKVNAKLGQISIFIDDKQCYIPLKNVQSPPPNIYKETLRQSSIHTIKYEVERIKQRMAKLKSPIVQDKHEELYHPRQVEKIMERKRFQCEVFNEILPKLQEENKRQKASLVKQLNQEINETNETISQLHQQIEKLLHQENLLPPEEYQQLVKQIAQQQIQKLEQSPPKSPRFQRSQQPQTLQYKRFERQHYHFHAKNLPLCIDQKLTDSNLLILMDIPPEKTVIFFKFKILNIKSKSIFIGVMPKQKIFFKQRGYQVGSCLMATGLLFYDKKNKKTGLEFKGGDIVTLVVNKKERSARWIVNKKKEEIALDTADNLDGNYVCFCELSDYKDCVEAWIDSSY